MKLALRYIPTEVWVDVFCYPWKSRKELGKIVDKFRNSYFAEILQYCLHERGKRTLGELDLDKEAIIPRTPVPENIKFFKSIIILHFDSSALAFLRNISPLFTNDVNLHFGFTLRDNSANLRTMLAHLTPMLHGIHSLTFKQDAIPLVQQYFGQKLAHIKMLTLQYDPATFQTNIDFCLNWLVSEGRDPAEPRFLKVYLYLCSRENLQQFSMAVRQQFLSAKITCTFAIKLFYYENIDQFANFHLENSIGEQLDGQYVAYRTFQIVRHKQVDSAREQLKEWVKVAVEKCGKSSRIELYGNTTIGPIEANDGADEADDNSGEEEEDGPSTSG